MPIKANKFGGVFKIIVWENRCVEALVDETEFDFDEVIPGALSAVIGVGSIAYSSQHCFGPYLKDIA
jgi:hypothetical protein